MTRLSNEQGRRADLKRFGYRSEVADPSAIWRQLRCDFPPPSNALELTELPVSARELAGRYCAWRATMDELLDRCDAIHLEILRGGPDRDVVETYVVARDAYEDAVEAFGEMRVELQAALAPR